MLIAAVAVVLYRGPAWLTDLQTKVPGYLDSAQRAIEGNHAARKALGDLKPKRRAQTPFASAESNSLW